MSLLDLFYPMIPHKRGRVIMQNIVTQENEVERKLRMRREYERRYREKNRKAMYEKIATYRAANKEKVVEWTKDWVKKNPEKMKIAQKRYRARNAVAIAKKAREDRLANLEVYKARRRANYLKHRDAELAAAKARRERVKAERKEQMGATTYGKNQEEKRAAAVRTMVAMGQGQIKPEGLRDSYMTTEHYEDEKAAW